MAQHSRFGDVDDISIIVSQNVLITSVSTLNEIVLCCRVSCSHLNLNIVNPDAVSVEIIIFGKVIELVGIRVVIEVNIDFHSV